MSTVGAAGWRMGRVVSPPTRHARAHRADPRASAPAMMQVSVASSAYLRPKVQWPEPETETSAVQHASAGLGAAFALLRLTTGASPAKTVKFLVPPERTPRLLNALAGKYRRPVRNHSQADHSIYRDPATNKAVGGVQGCYTQGGPWFTFRSV